MFLFFNAYVDPYYVAVLFITIVPLYFAFGIFFLYSEDKTKNGRERLKLGVILVIVAVILIATWTLYYYLVLYSYKDIYNGTGNKEDPDNYQRESKKQLIIITLLKALTIIMFFTFSWFSVEEWSEIGDAA